MLPLVLIRDEQRLGASEHLLTRHTDSTSVRLITLHVIRRRGGNSSGMLFFINNFNWNKLFLVIFFSAFLSIWSSAEGSYSNKDKARLFLHQSVNKRKAGARAACLQFFYQTRLFVESTMAWNKRFNARGRVNTRRAQTQQFIHHHSLICSLSDNRLNETYSKDCFYSCHSVIYMSCIICRKKNCRLCL